MSDNSHTEYSITQMLDKKYLETRNHKEAEYVVYRQLRCKAGYNCRNIADYVAISKYKPEFIVHEIKISRSDFMNDIKDFDKKQGLWLEQCSQFYYVCPDGLIDPGEVPEKCGLMWAQKSRIIAKKVAPIKDVHITLGTFQRLLQEEQRVLPRPPAYCKYNGQELDDAGIKKIVDGALGVERQMLRNQESNLKHQKTLLDLERKRMMEAQQSITALMKRGGFDGIVLDAQRNLAAATRSLDILIKTIKESEKEKNKG